MSNRGNPQKKYRDEGSYARMAFRIGYQAKMHSVTPLLDNIRTLNEKQ